MPSPGPAEDVEFFAAHPSAQWRVRPRRKGEFGEHKRWHRVSPHVLHSTHVLVVIDRATQPHTYAALPLVCPPAVAADPERLHAVGLLTLRRNPPPGLALDLRAPQQRPTANED